jgi:hypothetical protein
MTLSKSQNNSENKSKVDKIKDTDKGDRVNKETAFVGLELNVKPFRKWFKEHYERQSKNVGVVNAHYILASVDQIFIFSFLHSLSDSFKKNKSGMYDVTLESMTNHVKLTSYLNNTFGLFLDKYDDNIDYQKQLPVDKKALNEYITKFVFNDNFRMNINKDSMNFLIYLIVQANIILANTSLIVTEFAKKSRVTANSVISALKVHFSGKLLEDIMKKVDSVDTLLKNKEKQDSEKEEKNKEKSSDNNSDDDDDEDNKDNKEDKEEDKKESEEESEEESENESSESESENEEDSNLKSSQKPKKKLSPKKEVKSQKSKPVKQKK